MPETSVLVKAPLDSAAREEFSRNDADRVNVDDADRVNIDTDDDEDDASSFAEDAVAAAAAAAAAAVPAVELSRMEEDLAMAAEAALTSLLSTWPPHRRCFRSRMRASIRSENGGGGEREWALKGRGEGCWEGRRERLNSPINVFLY